MDLALLVSDFVDGGSGDSLDSSDYESGLSDLTDMISAAELLCCAWRCRPPASYACRRHLIRTGPGSRGAEVDESARAAEFGPTSSSKDSHQEHEADKALERRGSEGLLSRSTVHASGRDGEDKSGCSMNWK